MTEILPQHLVSLTAPRYNQSVWAPQQTETLGQNTRQRCPLVTGTGDALLREFIPDRLVRVHPEKGGAVSKDVERMRIRAKLSDEDRDFLDAIRQTFPSARMVGIRFSDGEDIGKTDGITAPETCD